MKQLFTFMLLCCFSLSGFSQILFSEDFNAVNLDDGAAPLPSDWVTENRDGQTAYSFPANFPFNLPAYADAAWAVTDFELGGEKAVISTAIHGPVDNVTDRWLMSPKVSGITATSYLFWEGFTDNGDALDNCEIWITSTIAGAQPSAADFLADNANRLMNFRMTPDEFNTYAARLSQFAGQDIYFAIRNISFIPARVVLDNFVIKDAVQNDLGVKNLAIEPYWVSGPTEIKVDILSLSPDPINAIELSYQVDGAGPIVKESFNVDLMEITDQTQITFDGWADLAEGGHDINVWVESVNGMTDNNSDNNAKDGFISVMNDPPLKRLLIQEYTGAWCGYCPEGSQFLEDLAKGDPTMVPVAIHSGDEMETLEGGTIAGIAASGYPSASFDFHRFPGEGDVGVGRNQWFNRALERIDAVVPVKVEVQSHTYNRDTRELEVTVKTDFIGATKEDLRLNVWLIEDEVTGPLGETGNNGWNNANYFDDDITSPFFGLGPYLEPDEFVHEHVLNASLTGTWGDDAAYPIEVSSGASFTNTYTYVLPEAAGAEQHWKAEDVHVVVFVSRFNVNPKKRSILNANRGITFLTGLGAPLEELASSQINPNPVSDRSTLTVNMVEAADLNIRIFNQLGLEVKSLQKAHFPEGESQLDLEMGDLSNGIYFVSLYHEDGGIHTMRVMVQK